MPADPDAGMRICAIVVTYQPQPDLLARVLQALAPQVECILLLDNASPEPALYAVPVDSGRPGSLPAGQTSAGHPSAGADPAVRRHRCRRNRGLAWTQNLGARWAWRAGFDAVLTMDQDSVPAPDMVARLVVVARELAATPLAAVAPRPVDARTGRPFPMLSRQPAAAHARWVACEFTIASGMLIARDAWRAVGPMRAELFIDHVDTEWCLRARAGGRLLAVVPGAHLEHRLGDGGRRLWLGRWRWFPYHSPLRHYYMVRNSRWLGRLPYVGTHWWRRTLLRAAGVVLLSLVFLPKRAERARRVWQAWRDAASGRMGAWKPVEPEAVAPWAHPSAEGRRDGRTKGPPGSDGRAD